MTDQPESHEQRETTAVTRVSIRRAPKYPVFIILGAGLGAVVAFILTALFPIDAAVGFGALFGYLALYGIPIGAVVGAVVAIVIDRVSSGRATIVDAERTTIDSRPAETEDEDVAP